jgi:hypothetical protein
VFVVCCCLLPCMLACAHDKLATTQRSTTPNDTPQVAAGVLCSNQRWHQPPRKHRTLHMERLTNACAGNARGDGRCAAHASRGGGTVVSGTHQRAANRRSVRV